MNVLTSREAAIMAALIDAVVAPLAPLPHVRDTDAVASFDAWLACSPRANRVVLRATLHALDLGSRVWGRAHRRHGRRGDRLGALRGLARIPVAGSLAEALRAAASLSYFGDLQVMRALGYDPGERVARGRELRRHR